MASPRRADHLSFAAVANGDLPALRRLADAGLLGHPRDPKRNTLLLAAAASGHLGVARWLVLREPPDWEQRNTSGATAFMAAACAGHLPMVEWIAAQGGSPVAPDRAGALPLHRAAARGHLPVVRWLVRARRDDLENPGGRLQVTPAQMAAGCGRLAVLQWLASQGANVAARTPLGDTALHFAVETGRLAVVEWLVTERGVGLEDRGTDGLTAFLCAARYGRSEVLRFLLGAGADAHARDVDGACALLLACASHDLASVRWLLEEGRADLAAVDDQGQSCLHWVARYVAPEAMELTLYLVGRGASVGAVDAAGRTAYLSLALGFYGGEDTDYEEHPEADGVFASECLIPLLLLETPPARFLRHTELVHEGTLRRMALPAWRQRLSTLVAGRGLPEALAALVVALAEPSVEEFWSASDLVASPTRKRARASTSR